MAVDKILKEEIAVNQDLGLLTRSYQEHAIGQINFARFSVLYSRDFSQELEEIFSNVRTSYFKIVNTKTIKNVIKKNNKDIWIFVAANNKLYGEIILKTSKLFLTKLKDTDPKKVDIAILGRQGKNIIDQAHINRPYDYLDIPDTNVTAEMLKKLSDKLINYENIYVFFGRYDNLVTQTPVQVAISGNILTADIKDTETQKKQSFLYEPKIEEILNYFENQILSLLFNQTVQEAQLARYASRINAMESAQTNINKQLQILIKQERMTKRMEMSKSQIQLLAGRSLWRRK